MNFCELKAIMTNIVSYMPPGLYGETPTYIFLKLAQGQFLFIS